MSSISLSPSLILSSLTNNLFLFSPRLSSSSSSEAVLVYTAARSSAAPASSRSRNLTREGAARPEILALTLVACSFLRSFFWAFLVKRNQGRKRRINELFAQPAHAERHTKETGGGKKGEEG